MSTGSAPDVSAPAALTAHSDGARARSSRWPYVSRMPGFIGISLAMIMVMVAAGSPTPLLPLYERQWQFPAWLVTVAFGVYAVGLLLAILVVGSLSDHVGRRPMMIGALALELVAMLMLAFAPGIGWLIAARVVQGVATGAASSSLSAAVVELAPERYKKTGALMAGLAPLAGLAIGSLFAGILAQTVTHAGPVVWFVLAAIMVLGTLFTLVTPETSARKPGALRSLVPSASLPEQVRKPFGLAVPGIIAAFMAMALFTGLVPILLVTVYNVDSPITGALVAFAAFAVAAVAPVATGRVKPHRLRLAGATALTVGAVLFIASISTQNVPLLWASAIFSGAGLGSQFSGTTRGLVPEVKPHQRAALFASIYLVAYLSMAVSVIAAGAVISALGATTVATLFGLVLALIAVGAIIAAASQGSRRTRHHSGSAR